MKSLTLALLLAISRAQAGDVLLHTGPAVAVDVSSLAKAEVTGEEIVFVKQFFIAAEKLAKLPPPSRPPALTRERAVELAISSVGPSTIQQPEVVKPELLQATPVGTSQPVEFYFVEVQRGSTSEQRVVLMDGTILTPRIKRVPGDKK